MTELLAPTKQELQSQLETETSRYWELQRELGECTLARAAILNTLKDMEAGEE